MNLLLPLWNAVFLCSLHASLLVGCVLLLRICLRKILPAQFFHLLWILVALRFVIPAAPHSTWSIFNLANRHTAPAAQIVDTGWIVRTLYSVPSHTEPPPSQAAPTLPGTKSIKDPTPRDLIAIVWLAGVAIQAASLFGASRRLSRKLADGGKISDGALQRLAADCARKMALRHTPRIIVTGAVASPAVIGLWRPRLLLPSGSSERFSRADLEFIFLHECAHVRRRDLAILWLMRLARILHWFNPLAWLAAALARHDSELACDESVLRRLPGNETPAYGEALLRLSQILPARLTFLPSSGVIESRRAMRTRILRIANYVPLRPGHLLACATLLTAIAIAFGADQKPPPQQTAPSPLTAGSHSASSPAASPSMSPPPAWAKGWAVTGVAIPRDGDIHDAYVYLTAPDGHKITFSPRWTDYDGVWLDNVEWTGSPVHVRVRLCTWQESTDLIASASLVSKSTSLEKLPSGIKCDSEFLEVPNVLVSKLPFIHSPGAEYRNPRPAKSPEASGETSPAAGPYVSVLDQDQVKVLVRAVHQLMDGDKEVKLLSTPHIVVRSDQRGVIELVQEYRYATEYAPPASNNSKPIPIAFETRIPGSTLEVEPRFQEDGLIKTELVPQIVQLLGKVDFETRNAARREWHEGDDSQPYPVFSTRTAHVDMEVSSGQTVVIAGLPETEDTAPFKSPVDDRTAIAIVTVSVNSSDENH